MAKVRMGNVESLVHLVSGDFYQEGNDTFFLITDGIYFALVGTNGEIVSSWFEKIAMEKHLNNSSHNYIHLPNAEIVVNK